MSLEGLSDEKISQWNKRLLHYASSSFSYAGEPEDLVQLVWMKILNNDNFDPEKANISYLYRTLSYVANDLYRRRIHELKEYSLEDPLLAIENTLVLDEPSPYDSCAYNETLHSLLEEIACLAPDYRDALVARGLADMSYNEIAEVFGIPLGIVKNRLFQARSVLKEHRRSV